jgi:hypothetical protein
MRGKGVAQAVALVLEYDWRPEVNFVRAALADHLLPDLGVRDQVEWQIVATHGGTDHWELVVRPTSDRSPKELLEYFDRALANGKWTRVKAAAARSEWTFKGGDGRPWKGAVSVEPGARGSVKLTIAAADRVTATSASP